MEERERREEREWRWVRVRVGVDGGEDGRRDWRVRFVLLVWE